MKCPKCGYIGFEAADRCRNCGNEFALAPAPEPSSDLSLRETDDAGGPLTELDLDRPAGRPARGRRGTSEPDLDRVIRNLDRVIGGPAPDLPLFGEGDAEGEDEPPPALVTPPASPRRPLAVRRTTPDPQRTSRSRGGAVPSPAPIPLPLPDAGVSSPTAARAADSDAGAAIDGGLGLRLAAALIDSVILFGIDGLVVYFTLRLAGLATSEVIVLPLAPLGAFFLLMNGGYLAAFTAAGGQTIGKMATGLKVVGAGGLPISAGLAVVRAAGCILSTLTLGLGFVPALIDRDGRSFHDRLADTRVVRAAR